LPVRMMPSWRTCRSMQPRFVPHCRPSGRLPSHVPPGPKRPRSDLLQRSIRSPSGTRSCRCGVREFIPALDLPRSGFALIWGAGRAPCAAMVVTAFFHKNPVHPTPTGSYEPNRTNTQEFSRKGAKPQRRKKESQISDFKSQIEMMQGLLIASPLFVVCFCALAALRLCVNSRTAAVSFANRPRPVST
jgi:hypothetical protein